MKPSILFVITGDPRTSARPAEAIRIAAGVSSWKKTDVHIYLHGAAVLALSPWADEFPDGDHYVRYLPLISEHEHAIHVDASAPELEELHSSAIPFRALNQEELGALCSSMTYVTRF